MKKQVTNIVIAVLFMVLTFVAVDFDLSWADTEETAEKSIVNTIAEEVEGEMEFLYIENCQLESPGTQNIAVAWDKDMSNVTEFILVYSDSKGNLYEVKETTRAEKSVLFAKEFSSSETGTYKINGMKYIVEGIEEAQYIDFKDLEIKADFEVVNKQNDSKVAIVESNVATISTDVETLSGDVENLLSTASVEPANNKGNIVVVIDPGHGGDDPGTCHYGLKEKDINLKIGKYLRDELKEYSGVEVYMTRETDKHLETATASGITNRVNYAKGKNADLLVSVHINAVGGRGAEVWAPNENYRSDIYEEGQGVSQEILDELVALGLYNRGVKESYSKNNTQYPDKSLADYYGIIRQSKEAGFVGIIVEHAFLDNASDAAFLSKEANLKKLGIADATGIANYYGLKKGVWITTSEGRKYQYTDGSFAKEKWISQGLNYFYIDENGLMATGLKNINGEVYYFDSLGIMKTGWIKVSNNWYYFNNNGTAKTGWLKLKGLWYYLQSDGKMCIGLQNINGSKYYFSSSGVMQTGWQITNGTWHYFNSDGMGIKGWLKERGMWYYLDEEGKMLTGLHEVNGAKYYFDSSGKMRTGWVKSNNIWYYFNGSGAAVKGWLKLKGLWYYLQSDGKMCIGLQSINGSKYYFSSSGVMQTGWQITNGTWYYFNSEGMGIKGWLKEQGVWYYLDEEGKMLTGLHEVNGAKYYFDSSGKMRTGWIKVNSIWYYFNGSGVAVEGWLKQGNAWYYMDNDCKMVTGTHTIDGEQYYFNSSGAWIQGTSISGESETTISQMVRYFNSSGAKYPSIVYESKGAPTLEDFCRIYYEEAIAEGIRVEVAFCQAMKETGWLQFGGDVKANQCNFAGIGAVGGGAAGHTFDDVRQGVRGHVQHLKAYANKNSLVNVCVDPRFDLVTRGVAPYVEWLGQKANPSGKGWAPSATYGTEIVKMMNELLNK